MPLQYVYRYVPESMRWLQTQNRIEEMANVLSKVAKSNGKTLPSSVKEALIANTKANADATNSVMIIYIIFISPQNL